MLFFTIYFFFIAIDRLSHVGMARFQVGAMEALELGPSDLPKLVLEDVYSTILLTMSPCSDKKFATFGLSESPLR